ncbi:MAG: hypothetical protein GVY18_09075 [Bacteroidetes bacterium]|jgi:hypothetical protein|nr:hypothetical protein [Bacteroidota bacterium]
MANRYAITLHESGSESSDGSGSGVDVTLDEDGDSTYPRSAARLTLELTAIAGTDPTLDVTVESSPGGSGSWEQVGSFDQMGAAGYQRLMIAGGERYLRVSWVLGGTGGPSATFAVSGYALSCFASPEDFGALGIPADVLAELGDEVKARQLVAATDRVASYVNAAWNLPMSSWGDDLRMATAQIAAWNALRIVGYRPDQFDETFRNAYYDLVGYETGREGWLQLVAAGRAAPVGIVDETPDTYDGGGFVFSDTARGW